MLAHGAAADSSCVPGRQVECACTNGGTGSQICSDDGASFSACECGASLPVAAGPVVASIPDPDAPAPVAPVLAPDSDWGPPPLPDRYPEPSMGPERRNRGAMIAGIVLLSVGAVGTAASAIALHFQMEEEDKCDSAQSSGSYCINEEELEIATAGKVVGIALGAAMTVTGIGLIAYGAPRVDERRPSAHVIVEVGPSFTGVKGGF
jgi:hypothetical protein